MTADTIASPVPPRRGPDRLIEFLPLILGLLALAVPTVIRLGEQTWSTDIGAHGPIVIGTGLWLLHSNGLRFSNQNRERIPFLVPVALFLVVLLTYVFGRAYDFISLEVFGLYGALIAMLLVLAGPAAMMRNAFPLVYIGFAIPLPGWLISTATAPLQALVSTTSEHVASLLGYPIARQGVLLFIAQYQLLVEDACAGMNSLIGLTSIGLLYIYLMHRASWRYAVLLILMILPVAILVNIVRVVVLIVITYHFGNAAAQGYLHSTTGMVLFAFSILMIFAIDKVFAKLGLLRMLG